MGHRIDESMHNADDCSRDMDPAHEALIETMDDIDSVPTRSADKKNCLKK